MKKLIIALAAIAGYCPAEAQTWQYTSGSFGAEAQQPAQTPAQTAGTREQRARLIPCIRQSNEVCTLEGGKKMCYNTKYNENFAVCKGNAGYFVCCENPGASNSTHPGFTVLDAPAAEAPQGENTMYVMRSRTDYTPYDVQDEAAIPESTTPQNQSYPSAEELKRESAFLTRGQVHGHIKVCYTGDNIAALNRNPYQGCPSPQYDGPDLNLERNVNVASPYANEPIVPEHR